MVFISCTGSYDVFLGLEGFSTFAVDVLFREELFSEFPCVCVASVTLY